MSKINEMKMQFENEVADGIFTAKTLEALAGCEDIMPGILCNDLDLPSGSTFRQGVRSIREASERAQEALQAEPQQEN